MKKHYPLVNAMLWAAAILVAALFEAPHAFSLILLPMLAALSQRMAGSHVCRHRSDIP